MNKLHGLFINSGFFTAAGQVIQRNFHCIGNFVGNFNRGIAVRVSGNGSHKIQIRQGDVLAWDNGNSSSYYTCDPSNKDATFVVIEYLQMPGIYTGVLFFSWIGTTFILNERRK